MSKVVPLFGSRKDKPEPEILCAECGREVERRRWAAWRERTGGLARGFFTVSLVTFAALYWGVAGFVLFGVVGPTYGGVVWLAGAGFVIFHMIRLAALVAHRMLRAPDTIIEHRHTQQEPLHHKARR